MPILIGWIVASEYGYLAEDAGTRLAMRRDDNGIFYAREYGNLWTRDYSAAYVYDNLHVADGRAGGMPHPAELVGLFDNGGALVPMTIRWSKEKGLTYATT